MFEIYRVDYSDEFRCFFFLENIHFMIYPTNGILSWSKGNKYYYEHNLNGVRENFYRITLSDVPNEVRKFIPPIWLAKFRIEEAKNA